MASAAREAATLALSYFQRDPTSWAKNGGSVVSVADMAVDALLKDRLRAARPDYGWLSEETTDTPDRRAARRVFVVDPIDGTRAFLAGRPEWMVSLAVVEGARPVAAALAAPVSGELYTATRAGGAWRDGQAVAVSAAHDPERATVASPKGGLDSRLPTFGTIVPRIPSLALRLTRVAEGKLDGALVSVDSHDWDLAGADLLIMEAGGRFSDFAGRPIAYNRATPRHPALVAGAPHLHAAILARLGVPAPSI
jgi:myo-inositol-1(or 4)-monophosphatase